MAPSAIPEEDVGDHLSLSKYASRRKEMGLRGGSTQSVSKAVKDRRLVNSVAWVDGDPKIIDADLADREWAENTRHKVGGPRPDPEPDASEDSMQFEEARRRHEIEKWRQAKVRRETEELDLAHRRGELVSVAEARADVVKRFSVVREKLLAIPNRIIQRTSITEEEGRLVKDLVWEALEAIADGSEAEG